MRRADRFRARSIAKPFVSVVVLQLAKRGRLSLDARLPEVLPADVVGRFPTAADITVRMLLGNRSRIPEWNTPALDEQAPVNPQRCGRFPSSSIWRPRSRRCSRPGRASSTPARTTTCWDWAGRSVPVRRSGRMTRRVTARRHERPVIRSMIKRKQKRVPSRLRVL